MKENKRGVNMVQYSKDQLIKALENYVDAFEDDDKKEVLRVLQCVNNRERGLLDFFGYYYIGNYEYEVDDVVLSLADEHNLDVRDFVSMNLEE